MDGGVGWLRVGVGWLSGWWSGVVEWMGWLRGWWVGWLSGWWSGGG